MSGGEHRAPSTNGSGDIAHATGAAQVPVGGRLKRIVDIAVALPAALLLTPAMVAIGVWIRRDSAGPAIFRQRRVGLHGREFTLLKFRTMVVNAENIGPGLAITENDSRITRSGALLRRLSLDELPQLWNVVMGHMSLVGPRPTVAQQVARYDARQRGRLRARPGLTGLAQVRGRASLPWSRRIEFDLEYVERWSPLLDLTILVRTVGVVLGREGTYKGETGGFDLPDKQATDG